MSDSEESTPDQRRDFTAMKLSDAASQKRAEREARRLTEQARRQADLATAMAAIDTHIAGGSKIAKYL